MKRRPVINPLQTPGLGLALEGPAKAKGKPGKIKDGKRQAAKLMRVSGKAPEVVVRVRPGGTKGPGHILAHMTYITRNGKLDGYNERDEVVKGVPEVKAVFKEWGFSTANASTRQRAQTVNMVLSMPAGTDPDAVLQSSRAFAKKEFSANHQYLLALHTDTEQPHVHLSVKAQGFDLTWLKRSPEDLQRWREEFAEQLRERGVEAEATPRQARGVVRKAKSQPMHHLAKEPKRSRVMTAKVEEAVRDVTTGVRLPERPWEKAIKARQAQVRDTYAAAEKELRLRGEPETKAAADQLAGFLRNMPAIETEGGAMRRQLSKLMEVDRSRQGVKAHEQAKSAPGGPIVGRDEGQGGQEK
jgi:uncharacterized membrane protein